MKNAYAKKLFQTKENAYADGVWEGLQLGLNLAAIALNHIEAAVRQIRGKGGRE